MNFLYYGAAVASCLLVFAFLFFLKNKNVFGERFNNARVVALLYSALFFVRFLGGQPLIQNTIGLNVYSPFGPQGGNMVLLSTVLFWLIYVVQLAAITYPFFETIFPASSEQKAMFLVARKTENVTLIMKRIQKI